MEEDTDLQEQYTAELSPIVEQAGEAPLTLTLVNYNLTEITERSQVSVSECQAYLNQKAYTWLHVQGQPKPVVLRELGQLFNLHHMALEDVINIGERAKTEFYDSQIMLILGMLNKEGSQIFSQQVSIFLGENFLVSFHNGSEDPFERIEALYGVNTLRAK